ncbi:MAG: TetR/AcrR family transcriptional regulator [Bacteroidota bacterium]
MGIRERRQREIEAVKAHILQAARDIALKKGWPTVSIRKIAEIIEYTPPVIYEHYKNKEAILAALESLGFEELKKKLDDAARETKEADKQLRELSLAYWHFAFEFPELYQVMYNLEGTQSSSPNHQAIRESGNAVIETLRYLHTFPAQRESLFFNWWSLAHGYVSLVMSGQLPGMQDQLKQYFLEAVERLQGGMN